MALITRKKGKISYIGAEREDSKYLLVRDNPLVDRISRKYPKKGLDNRNKTLNKNRILAKDLVKKAVNETGYASVAKKMYKEGNYNFSEGVIETAINAYNNPIKKREKRKEKYYMDGFRGKKDSIFYPHLSKRKIEEEIQQFDPDKIADEILQIE